MLQEFRFFFYSIFFAFYSQVRTQYAIESCQIDTFTYTCYFCSCFILCDFFFAHMSVLSRYIMTLRVQFEYSTICCSCWMSARPSLLTTCQPLKRITSHIINLEKSMQNQKGNLSTACLLVMACSVSYQYQFKEQAKPIKKTLVTCFLRFILQ